MQDQGQGQDHGRSHSHCHSVEENEEKMVEKYRLYDSCGKMFAPEVAKAFDLSQHKSAVDLGGERERVSFTRLFLIR